MELKQYIEITNEWEIARLLSLIDDGKARLNKEQRSQRGIDGYTNDDLIKWTNILSKMTDVRCEFAR